MTAPQLALRRELARKALHLTSAAAPIAYAAGAPRETLLGALSILTAIALVVETSRRTIPAAQQLLDHTVGSLFRSHERASVTGATWLMLALTAAVLLLPREPAIATMWAVAVGDPAAALVGRTIGRIRPRPGGKSLEGALACLATTFAGALLVARLPVESAAAAGVAAMLAEWPAGPFDDNVRIAVGVACTVMLLRLFVL